MPPNIRFVSDPNNLSMPSATVIPVLHYPDVSAASAWLCRAFGFSERLRIGTHRIQLNAGEGAIVVAQGLKSAQGREINDHSVMVRVQNIEQLFEAARKAGAEIICGLTSYPYGERQFSAADPGGHVWTFSQTEADIEPAAWGGELVQGG